MKRIKEIVIALSYMLSIPILFKVYGLLDNPGHGIHSLVTVFDRSLPFIKQFVIPYAGWPLFLILGLSYLCWKDRPTYYRSLFAINISVLIAYIIYSFYQTTVPRPTLYGTDWLTRLVDLVYQVDPPYNCFPSIHVLTSYILMRSIYTSPVRTRLNLTIIGSSAVAIILSTMFIKQHVILDVIAAILLGHIVYTASLNLSKERLLLWTKKPFSLLTTKEKLAIWFKSI